MKQKKLSSLLAVTLSLELMVSPLIPAAHAQSGSTMSNINQGLQALGQVWNTANQMNQQNTGINAGQMAADMNKMREQQTPQPDKYFNAQKLMQVPGLGEYMARNNLNPNSLECKTLPTTLHDAKPEVCRIGITSDKGVPPPAQLDQMFTYYNQYFQTSKMYKNFSADSNSEGQAFGLGCMNNAMNILNGFFKYRLNELDKLTTNLEAMQAQFEAASRSDLDAIEESVAVLEGDSEIADKVRSKKPGLFDFDKRFSNPACKAMFAGNAINDKGRSGGLNAISRDVKDLLTQKTGKYSGESYSQSHAQVVQDIGAVADKVAKQFQLNFTPNLGNGEYNAFLKSAGSLVSSSTGVQDAIRPDLLADVQTKFMEKNAKLQADRAAIQSELKGSERAMSLLGNLNSSASFDAEVNTIENGMKNECLSNGIGSTDTLLSKIYDPSASKHANKNASNFLKDKLKMILSNEKSSPEKKLADLKSLEAEQGNRYYVRMQNSYEVQDVDSEGNIKSTVIDPSQSRSPSVYFSDVIKNCNAQFKANKLNNKMTGAQAIQKLRDLNNSYKNLAETQSADIKQELRKKLIECSSPEIAKNSVPGSCQPGLFNTSSPGFCANAALSCSQNMQACNKQAEGFVKEIRDQKTARVNNYKALVNKNKQDIIKIFDSALARYMKDGEMMRGMFGAGFSSPANIKREVPEAQRYLGTFASATGKQGSPDGKLLLEDPAKYTEMFKANIALLKKSVQDQQDQILGGDRVDGKAESKQGLLADHIRKTKDNYDKVIKEADAIAKECLNNHDQAIKAAEAQRAQQKADYDKKMSELGEKQRDYCRRFSLAVGNHPGPACNGSVDETFSVLGTSSQRLQALCDGTQGSSSSNNKAQAYKVCRPYKTNGGPSVSVTISDEQINSDQTVVDAQSAYDIAKTAYEDAKKDAEADTSKRDDRDAKFKTMKQKEAAVTKAKADAKAKLTAAANPQSGSTATTETDSTAGTTQIDPQMKSMCEQFLRCATPGSSRELANGTTVTTKACDDSETSSYADDIVKSAGGAPTPTADEAPAYCNAGNNSGRESDGGWLKQFSDSFAKAAGSTAQ